MQTSAPAEIFDRLKQLVFPYEKEMEINTDGPGHYELRIPGTYSVGDNRNHQSYYCTVFLKTSSVFFSLIVYRLLPEIFDTPASLKKALRKDGAFDFKKLDDEQEVAIALLFLQQGFAMYKKNFIQV